VSTLNSSPAYTIIAFGQIHDAHDVSSWCGAAGSQVMRRWASRDATELAARLGGAGMSQPWRHAKVTDQRTSLDFAECMRDLVDEHASWLNMVEIEIGVMVRQCLSRRIAEKATLVAEIAGWERRRNAENARIEWMFTVDRAREKLRRAYPIPANQPRRAIKLAA
jgi:hypothetical protein